MKKTGLRLMAAVALGVASFYSWAAAEQWPGARPISIIVPWTPGGLNDQMARMIAQHLSKTLNQPVIVENKPGAGSIIGSQYVANAKPDGYTFLMGSTSNVLNQYIYSKLPYDTRRDLLPVAQVIQMPNWLIVAPNSRFKTIQDVIDQARTQKKSVSCANYGAGTAGHLSCELLARMAGVEFVNVPYKGGMPTIQDTMAGQVDMAMVVEGLPFVTDRKVRAIAVTTPERNPYMPDVPAIAEKLPGYDVTSWIGLFAPAGTPEAIVKRVSDDVQVFLKDAAAKERMKSIGVIPVLRPSKEFAAYVNHEFDRWGVLLKPMNIRLD